MRVEGSRIWKEKVEDSKITRYVFLIRIMKNKFSEQRKQTKAAQTQSFGRQLEQFSKAM